MSDILVSVVIPAYNAAAHISMALDSVFAQQVPLEVIVVDDCSGDDLAVVLRPYAEDPRFRYIRNPQNLGVSATRNLGVSLARGEFVAFLDADDYWTPDKLVKQLRAIRESGMVLCTTARELMEPDGTLTGYIIPVQPWISYRDLKRQNPINCSSVLIRTEVARQFPMRRDDTHEDYLMWLEVLEKYGCACAINEPLLKYRVSQEGKSGKKLHSAQMTFRTYRSKGFGLAQSVLSFISYGFCGVRKYFFWYLRKRRGT